jgi:hypothetical protein
MDGSPQSFGALMTAVDLARTFGKKVEAIARHDPYLHYSVFNGIVNVLTEQAAKVFRFEENQLHEEIIDTGLAKIISLISRWRADGERRASRSRRRSSTASPSRRSSTTAQDQSSAHRHGTIASTARRTMGFGSNAETPARRLRCPSPRGSMHSAPTCEPRRPSDGRRRLRLV